MPRGDRTGPMGQGAMTGRAVGICAGNASPGFSKSGPGQGQGRGRGSARGSGRRNRFFAFGMPGQRRAPMQTETRSGDASEIELLQAQAAQLEGALVDLNRRIQELDEAREK